MSEVKEEGRKEGNCSGCLGGFGELRKEKTVGVRSNLNSPRNKRSDKRQIGANKAR